MFNKEELKVLLSDDLTEEQFKEFCLEKVYNSYAEGINDRLSVIKNIKINEVKGVSIKFRNV